MAAAPFALTGIGAIAGLAVLVAAVTITRVNRNRNQKEMDDDVLKMIIAEERMEANQKWVSKHQNEAARITKRLIKTTAILEHLHGLNKSSSSGRGKPYHSGSGSCDCVPNIGEALREAEKLVQGMEEGLPYDRLYLERPSAVTSINSIHSERDSLHIVWEDPDYGESEIESYNVTLSQGFFGDDEERCVGEPEVTFSELEPGKDYDFIITARNPIGCGEESEEFKAQTTR